LETMLFFPTQEPPRLAEGQTAFNVSSVRAQAAEQSRVVDLIATKNESMRVRLTAQFEFLRVELSPAFEIVAVVLRARASPVQIGTGSGQQTSPFELVETRLNASGQLSELFVRAR
jgi:hypothetical protein